MAEKNATIRYEPGRMVNASPRQLRLFEERKARNGITQIERVLQGLEQPPADAEQERRAARAAVEAAELKVVGVPTVDIHAREKVTGRARYPVDYFPSGVLYTRVLRSPYPRARVLRIDTSKAEAYPGVAAVVTFEDIAEVSRAGVTGEAQVAGGIAKPALDGEPPWAGAGVAAVAAESEAIAEEALDLIEVDYEQLPFVLGARQALAPGAPKVRSDVESNAAFDPQFAYGRGDIEQGFTEADFVLEVESASAYEQHVPMEPHAAIAEWDADDTLTVWSSTQYPHGMRNGIAETLRMPQSKIRVLAEHTGSGWGDKTGAHAYHIYAALLARKTRRPVRYVSTRKDQFVEQGHNYPKDAEVRMGFRRDGSVTAIEGVSYIPVGAYNESLGNSDDWEAFSRLYRCANVSVRGNAALTNTVITSPLRCVGEPGGIFTLELAMDMAAERLDMDPLALRLKNVEEEVDQVVDLPYSSCGIREALQKGAEAFGWAQRWQGWDRGRDVRIGDAPVRGVGMAAAEINKGGAFLARTANVHIDPDGSVSVHTGAADIGGGQATVWSMIAAEAVGVPLAQVKIYRMDTAAGPDSSGIFGSRGTKTVGMAVLEAAKDARGKLLAAAAGSLATPPPRGRGLEVTGEDLDIADGMVFVTDDPSIRLPVPAVVGAGGSIIGTARLAPFISGWSQKTFAAGFYEVEVDPGTGFVRVTDAVQVHDVGKAINPTAVRNQIVGGMMQGIDKALTAELIYDPPTGVIVNPNLDEYKLHMIDALPERVQALFVEPIDVVGPYGAKGVGEPPIVLAMPTVASAIYNAIGVRLHEVPFSPPRVLNALRGKTG